MLIDVMREVRNSFWDGYSIRGRFAVSQGRIELPGKFSPGHYVLLRGEFGDSVYLLNKRRNSSVEFNLKNSTNRVYDSAFRLRIPLDFIGLVDEIMEYKKNSPGLGIVSEQFGEYRYTLNQSQKGWETVFRKSLNRYRKMSDILF